MMSSQDFEQLKVLEQATRAAAEIFTQKPRQHAALAYLAQRGIDAGGLGEAWVIGYAPPGWTRLTSELRSAYDEQVLLDAGLARRSSRGSLIDAFRDRVLFGIRKPDGTIAGFIGRDLSGDPGAPKYLNSTQSPLFDKGSLLFGLNEGLACEGASQPVVVEGPVDVLAIAARQYNGGALLPVAACGTAFTVTHARQVADVARANRTAVVVAMDGDGAGRKAALDAGERLRYVDADARVAALPNGTDPADHLAPPRATLDVFVAANAQPLITLHVRDAIARQGDRMQWVEGRLGAAREITAYLATYPASEAARQIGWLADVLGLDAHTVTAELADAFGRANAERTACPEIPPRHLAAAPTIGGIG